MSSESGDVDSMWALLQEEEVHKNAEYRKRVESIKSKQSSKDAKALAALLKESSKKEPATQKQLPSKQKSIEHQAGAVTKKSIKKDKATAAANGMEQVQQLLASRSLSDSSSAHRDPEQHHPKGTSAEEVKTIDTAEMLALIARDVSFCNYDGGITSPQRAKALAELCNKLFVRHNISPRGYSDVFEEIGRPLFKVFADSSEKCRELSMRLVCQFFERSTDIVSVLGYFFPAFMQRLPPGLGYDEELKVFVVDMEAHDAYKRGKAVDRQDRTPASTPASSTSVAGHVVVEPSEEIRLLTCRTLSALLHRVVEIDAASILHPYFHEMVMYLQMQLRDPYPELKMEACALLARMAVLADFEAGMKYYAVALVRAVLPVLRHRHAKVRVAAVVCLKAVMMVPDRAKLKGSGTEAMCELVGFREENVLQVSSFYKADIQINYLAELVMDSSIQVKEKVADMLTGFLTELGDRYDHQSRLVPYLLDLLTDPAESVYAIAWGCLQTCGAQYEEEHHKEILEKRQYGVDGDDRINLSKPLPAPFRERPRIGIRLYIRGNTKRFIFALVNELTNWIGHTRLKSALLLKVVVVLCEEHLTMEAHQLLPSYIKALGFAKDDHDKSLYAALLDVYELVGRYFLPEVYIHYILPRLRGDPDIIQFGVDSSTRVVVLETLKALMEGSKPTQVAPFFEEIVSCLADPFVISQESQALQSAALDTLLTILRIVKSHGKATIEGHFLSTGRLTTLKRGIDRSFEMLVFNLDDPVLHDRAMEGLQLLAQLVSVSSNWTAMRELFAQCGTRWVQDMLQTEKYEVDGSWSPQMAAHRMLRNIVESPWNIIQGNNALLLQTIQFCNDLISPEVCAGLSATQLPVFYGAISGLLGNLLSPVVFDRFDVPKSRLFVYKEVWRQLALGDSLAPGLTSTHPIEVRNAVLSSFSQTTVQTAFQRFVVRQEHTAAEEAQKLSVMCLLIGYSAIPQDENSAPPCLLELTSDVVASLVFLCNAYRQPNNPLAYRKTIAEVTGHIMHRLAKQSVVGYPRLKPYTNQKSQHQPQRGSDVVEHARVLVRSLLLQVSDSHDEVRLSAMESLPAASYFIASDLHDQGNHAPADDEDAQRSAVNTVARLAQGDASITFSDVVAFLLEELTSSRSTRTPGESSEYVIAVETVLRSYAVLDPMCFETLTRYHLSSLTGKNSVSPENIELLGGLVDHASLLASLKP